MITMVGSPAGTNCSIELSNQTLVPSMSTAPFSVEMACNPVNQSPVRAVSVRAASSCDSPRSLMLSRGTSFSFGHVVDVFCTQNDTSGGSQ
jgi:hypothetical protein